MHIFTHCVINSHADKKCTMHSCRMTAQHFAKNEPTCKYSSDSCDKNALPADDRNRQSFVFVFVHKPTWVWDTLWHSLSKEENSIRFISGSGGKTWHRLGLAVSVVSINSERQIQRVSAQIIHLRSPYINPPTRAGCFVWKNRPLSHRQHNALKQERFLQASALLLRMIPGTYSFYRQSVFCRGGD